MTRRSAARWFLAAAAACVLLLGGPAPASAATADAVRAVEAFDPANPASYRPLTGAVVLGGVDVRALRAHLRSRDLHRRWAATYVGHNLARTRAELDLIRERLRDANPSIRAMAIFALAGRGEKAMLPRLIALLRSRRFMLHGEPPSRLASLANTRLVALTGRDFGFAANASERRRRTAIRRWEEWWRRGARGAGYRAPRRVLGHGRIHGRTATNHDAVFAARTGENVTITVRLEFFGPGTTSQTARDRLRRLVGEAEGILNGGGRTGQCFDIRLRLEPRFGQNTPGHNQVYVTSLTSAFVRSEVHSRPGGAPEIGIWSGVDMQGAEAKWIVAHETGHFLDLDDEYLDAATGSAILDPDSLLAEHVNGDLRQRHLDFLANAWVSDRIGCQRWRLKVGWTGRLVAHTVDDGTEKTHHISHAATASVHADFWLATDSGRVRPAGHRPGGDVFVTRRHHDVHGASRVDALSADRGSAPCSRVSIGHVRRRWDTRVTGQRAGGDVRLQLGVDDRQRTRNRCTPAAEPPAGGKSLIRGSMQAAGALDFTIPLRDGAERPFHFDQGHRTAFGTAVLGIAP